MTIRFKKAKDFKPKIRIGSIGTNLSNSFNKAKNLGLLPKNQSSPKQFLSRTESESSFKSNCIQINSQIEDYLKKYAPNVLENPLLKYSVLNLIEERLKHEQLDSILKGEDWSSIYQNLLDTKNSESTLLGSTKAEFTEN